MSFREGRVESFLIDTSNILTLLSINDYTLGHNESVERSHIYISVDRK